MRKALAAAVTTALVMFPSAAFAAPGPDNPHSPAPHVRPAPLPLCVTTIWRSKHTHQPKTRPGEICLLTEDMWLPRSWYILAVGQIGNGRVFMIVQRPPRR